MTAIIYAAGRAIRLGPAHAEIPKVMIDVGGRTLLEWHAIRLARIGIRRLIVVTGHQRHSISEVLPVLTKRHDFAVAEIHNPDFTEGSVLSLHVSLPEILRATEPLLLMDGDVLYAGAILQRLVNSAHSSALLIDRGYSTDDDDPVLVPLRAGAPFDFVKKWAGKADAVGESIGFFKVSRTDWPMLVEETERRTVGSGRLDSYDEVLRALVQAGRFGCEDVTGLPWTEIDFQKDLDYARGTVLPDVLKLEPVPPQCEAGSALRPLDEVKISRPR